MSDPAAPSTPPAQELTSEQADATIASRSFIALLVMVGIIGLIVSLAAWCFLMGTYQLQQELYVHLPHALGYQGTAPKWWPLPVLALGALVAALAIDRLPGDGGHIPAKGLAFGGGKPNPRFLPGVIAAGAATIGFGLVLGPEAPLIALGSGLAAYSLQLLRRDTPDQVTAVVVAAGAFAAVSFIFDSPLIAAVLLIEATAIGGPKLRIVLVPGLFAAGIGTLVSVGIGHFSGLSSSAYSLGALPLTPLKHVTFVEVLWTIAVASLVAALVRVAMLGGKLTYATVSRRRLVVVLPVVGLVIAILAILFQQITGVGSSEVLFSGQSALPGLVAHAGAWTVGTLVLLVVMKGIAYALSLGSFRGGPTFPALFLGAAIGMICARLPGYPVQVAVLVGLGTATVALLRLPLTAVVLATVLGSHAGSDVEPLIIVGVVVGYVVTLLLERRMNSAASDKVSPTPAAHQPTTASGTTTVADPSAAAGSGPAQASSP